MVLLAVGHAELLTGVDASHQVTLIALNPAIQESPVTPEPVFK